MNAALKGGHGGAVLDQDRASIEARAALEANHLDKAQQIVAHIPVGASGNPASAHMNLALASVYAKSQQQAQAEGRIDGWLHSRLAPALAYLQKAAYLYQRRHFKEAEEVMHRGAERLDAWATLLPYLVTTALAEGDTPKAEEYTRRCAEIDKKSSSFNPLRLLSKSGGPLYTQCRARLGHDPPATSGGSNPLSGAVEGTKHLFDKLKNN
jgi:tetratricopeptide (TPR) repeat protein